MPGHTTHSRKLTPDIVFDAPQFLGVVAPRHDIAVRPDAGQSVGMGLVQVTVYPFLVDRVAAAVLGKTVHVAGGLLEAGKILVVAVDKHILVVYVVARQQQSDGRSKREAAVGAVSR